MRYLPVQLRGELDPAAVKRSGRLDGAYGEKVGGKLIRRRRLDLGGGGSTWVAEGGGW